MVTRHSRGRLPAVTLRGQQHVGGLRGHFGDAGATTVVRRGAALVGAAESRPGKPCADFTHGSLHLAGRPSC